MTPLLAAIVDIDLGIILALISIGAAVWSAIGLWHKNNRVIERAIEANATRQKLTEQRLGAALSMIEYRLKSLEEFTEKTTGFARRDVPDQTGSSWLRDFTERDGG